MKLALIIGLGLGLGACHAAPARTIVTETDIEVLTPPGFVGDTTELRPDGLPSLDALARTLDGNPGIALVEVQVIGDAAHPGLARQRAAAIIAYLVGKGVAASRLQPGERAAGGRDAVVYEILKRS